MRLGKPVGERLEGRSAISVGKSNGNQNENQVSAPTRVQQPTFDQTPDDALVPTPPNEQPASHVAVTASERDAHGRFLTGNSGGGRPRGARNKLAERFLDTIADDFSEHGAEAIAKVRTDDPATYLKIVGSLIPRNLILDREYGQGFIGKVNASTNNYVNALTIRFVKPEPNNNNVIGKID